MWTPTERDFVAGGPTLLPLMKREAFWVVIFKRHRMIPNNRYMWKKKLHHQPAWKISFQKLGDIFRSNVKKNVMFPAIVSGYAWCMIHRGCVPNTRLREQVFCETCCLLHAADSGQLIRYLRLLSGGCFWGWIIVPDGVQAVISPFAKKKVVIGDNQTFV